MTGLDWTDHSLINCLALAIIMIELTHLTPSVTEWENARKLVLHHPDTPSPGIKDAVFLNLLLGAFMFYARAKALGQDKCVQILVAGKLRPVSVPFMQKDKR